MNIVDIPTYQMALKRCADWRAAVERISETMSDEDEPEVHRTYRAMMNLFPVIEKHNEGTYDE